MNANALAAKFYAQADKSKISADGKIYQMITRKQAEWFFRTAGNELAKSGERVHQRNGKDVFCGTFKTDTGLEIAYDVNEWRGGAARVIYSPIIEKAAEPAKSNALVIAEAMLDAFLAVDDELDYSTFSDAEKNMLALQRKALFKEVRMNK